MMGMGLGLGMGMNLQQPVLSSVGRGLPLQPPAGPGQSGLGMGLGMGMGMGLGGLPGAFPQPIGRGMPLALPRGPAPAPAPVAVGDPNNEVSSWSEHVAEDKRKYWYNRVNGTSTYDKPFCLKTPEERSIPPCKWKEYTAADGKKYYSDGKESSWTMPEEFRVWKEKMDAVERKKLAALMPPDVSHTALTSSVAYAEHATTAASLVAAAPAASANTSSNGAGMGAGAGAGSSSGISSTAGSSGTVNRKKQVEEDEPKPVIVYATQEEAVEAFKAMLTERKVSHTSYLAVRSPSITAKLQYAEGLTCFCKSVEKKRFLALDPRSHYLVLSSLPEGGCYLINALVDDNSTLYPLPHNILMTTLQVLTTMKMKEVQDLCQSDPRFNALKSGGEKKQALAEYQVRRERRPSFIPYSLSLHLPIDSNIVYPISLSFSPPLSLPQHHISPQDLSSTHNFDSHRHIIIFILTPYSTFPFEHCSYRRRHSN